MGRNHKNRVIANRIIREPKPQENMAVINLAPPSDNNKWLSCFDPLQGLTIDGAKNIYDMSLAGNYCRISYLYDRIESAMPELLVCCERRASALTELDWTVRNKDSRKRGFDSGLADEQNKMLSEQFANLEDSNLWDTIEHLSSAFFRGFALGLPIFSNGGKDIESVELINHWNICRDQISGEWYYNPDCKEVLKFDALTALPINQIITLSRPRHIDYPALLIAIRASMGETLYSQMLARYGVPPVIITAPEKLPANQLQAFATSAGQMAQGGYGALPYGSTVTWATAPSGAAPFESFLTYQKQQVVLLATGGLATSLDMAQGLGSGTSDAHKSTWETIVSRDSALVANAINKAISSRLLDTNFPGRPHLASFDFETAKPASAKEVFETAVIAKQAGLLIDLEEMQQKTGYTLTREIAPAQQPFGLASNGQAQMINSVATEPKEEPKEEPQAETPAETATELEQAIVSDRANLAQNVVDALKSDNPQEAAKEMLAEMEKAEPSGKTEEILEEIYARKFVEGVK